MGLTRDGRRQADQNLQELQEGRIIGPRPECLGLQPPKLLQHRGYDLKSVGHLGVF